MCNILSRLSTVVKIVISMRVDIFHVLFFTFFTPVYRCFTFSSIFPLQNCIQVCSSLKSILKITFFCIVEKPLFLCGFFYPEQFSIHFFRRKESMKVSCYILYFSNTNIDFLTISYCIVFYLPYTFNTDTWREWKMLSGLICSR
jgi:hypothetical protein